MCGIYPPQPPFLVGLFPKKPFSSSIINHIDHNYMSLIRIQKSKLSNQVKAQDNQSHDCPYNVPIPQHPHNALIVGRRNSGKSTTLLSLLNTDVAKGGLRRRFKRIYIISPTMPHDPKFKKLYDEVNDEGNYYELPTEENFAEILEKIKAMREEDPKEESLLILDDVIDKLAKSNSNSILNHAIICGRHYKLSIYTLSQKFNSISTIARCNAEVIICFNIANKKEYESFRDELNYDAKKFDDIYNVAMNGGGSHNFLTINSANCRMRFFRRFDPIIIEEESESDE